MSTASQTSQFPIHPAAELFPLLPDSELRELADDIKQNGLLDPIVVFDNKVLDGRNRLRACELAGVDAEFVYPEISDPFAYVASKNLHRRHLTHGQRAQIAAEMMPLLREAAKARQLSHLKQGESSPLCRTQQDGESGAARAVAARLMGVGESAVQQAINAKRDNPEGYEKVKRGEMTINAAASGHTEQPKQGGQQPRDTNTERGQVRAHAHKRRMVDALSVATGLCRGLASADIPVLKAALDKEEIQLWANKAREISKGFRNFASQLEKN